MTKNFKNLALVGATAVAIMLAPAAFAGDNTNAAFSVERTSNPAVRVAVKAFKKGDYAKSVQFSQQALRSGLSKSRASVAQSNLCASHAMLGEMEKAAEACVAALDLKPENETALANSKALTVKLAQMNSQAGN